MIEITPATTSLLAETTQQFAASLAGVASVQVTWSISEGADGGSIDSSGLYTAPMTGGTFHVVASPVGVEATPGMATVDVDRPPPGSLDTSFADGGVLIFDPLPGGYCPRTPCAAAILILDGGIIAVAGTEDDSAGAVHTAVVELDESGKEVPGFELTGGYALDVHSFEVQPPGKFLLAGGLPSSDGLGGVERRESTGKIDLAFGDAGLVFPAVTALPNTTPLAVLPDSTFIMGDSQARDGGSYLLLSRFSVDGLLQGSTALPGSDLNRGQIAEQLVLLSPSSLLAVAVQTGNPDTHLVFANISGTSVSEEIEDAYEGLPFTRSPYVTAVSANQSWVVAVESPACVVRLDLDAGASDATFEENANAAVGGLDAGLIMGLALDASSRSIIAIVSNDPARVDDLILLRIDGSGGSDPSFGNGGTVRIPVGEIAAAETVALQPDGKIVVGGKAGQHWLVARIWP